MSSAPSMLHDSCSDRHPPQFRLRTLLLVVTLCGVLFALMSALSAVGSTLLLFFLALVAAHVFGNAIGTRLRDDASGRDATADAKSQSGSASGLPVPAAQWLRERAGISRTMVVTAALGAVLGGTSGGFALAVWIDERANIAGLGLGTFSSAVLGCFCGFLLSSFFSVFSRALREALGDPTGPPAQASAATAIRRRKSAS